MSAEHEVSLASARSVIEAAAGLDVVPLVIGRDGALLNRHESYRLLGLPPGTTEAESAHESRPVQQLATGASGGALALAGAAAEADVVFPLLHGPFGEDGRVQGLLDMLGLPYVGAGVFGSAVAMDKLGMKALFAAHGLPQVSYEPLTRRQWQQDPEATSRRLARLSYPLFVKPANLGSSIGISRVDHADQLASALTASFEHDRRVIVEEAAQDVRELEIGVLGNDDPQLSVVGEIRYQAGFYDYETKYTDGHAELIVPAQVPQDTLARLTDLARRAFLAVDAAGLARVDFFYRESTGELLLNEINTMPGFTRHSMYPKLWQAAGVSYTELIRRLVALALEQR
jgi:D-alanine-D-alanine ligase